MVVGKAGTAVVTPAELIEAEVSQHASAAVAKVTPLDELAAEVETWRRQGLKGRLHQRPVSTFCTGATSPIWPRRAAGATGWWWR